MSRDIEIYIDELVLHGFARDDSEGIKNAVEAELARLFKEQGLPASISSPKNYRRIEAGGFSMRRGANAGAVGNDIAGSVYHGIKNHKSSFNK